MKLESAHIGFPEGVLNQKHYRMPVAMGDGCFFIEKLPGFVGLQHPVSGKYPNLGEAIAMQAKRGKPELERLGISEVHFVAGPEGDVFGPCLYACSEARASELRNLLGSREIEFEYYFVTRQNEAMEPRVCALPLARHFTEPRMLVSRQTGKKCETRFEQVARTAGFSLFRATTTYQRLHQVRVHAKESGIPIAGDRRYTGHGPVNSAELNQNHRGEGRVVWPWPALWLQSVSFPWAGEQCRYQVASLPKALRGILRKLDAMGLFEA